MQYLYLNLSLCLFFYTKHFNSYRVLIDCEVSKSVCKNNHTYFISTKYKSVCSGHFAFLVPLTNSCVSIYSKI